MSRSTLLSSRLITMFGLGHMRPASGTWGSLPPVVWAAGLMALAWLTPLDPLIWWTFHLSLWCVLLLCSWAVIAGGERAEAVFGADPSEVVADETAGQCIPLLLMPVSLLAGAWWHAAIALGLAFVLFRLADIFKPYPCNALQRVPAGWGILLDDLVAGVYAALGLWIIAWIW